MAHGAGMMQAFLSVCFSLLPVTSGGRGGSRPQRGRFEEKPKYSLCYPSLVNESASSVITLPQIRFESLLIHPKPPITPNLPDCSHLNESQLSLCPVSSQLSHLLKCKSDVTSYLKPILGFPSSLKALFCPINPVSFGPTPPLSSPDPFLSAPSFRSLSRLRFFHPRAFALVAPFTQNSSSLHSSGFLSFRSHLKCHCLREAFPDHPDQSSSPSHFYHITLIGFAACICFNGLLPLRYQLSGIETLSAFVHCFLFVHCCIPSD